MSCVPCPSNSNSASCACLAMRTISVTNYGVTATLNGGLTTDVAAAERRAAAGGKRDIDGVGDVRCAVDQGAVEIEQHEAGHTVHAPAAIAARSAAMVVA